MDGSVIYVLNPATTHTKLHAAALLPTYTQNMLVYGYSVAAISVKYRFDTREQAIEQVFAS
jgi:hypothetical protein